MTRTDAQHMFDELWDEAPNVSHNAVYRPDEVRCKRGRRSNWRHVSASGGRAALSSVSVPPTGVFLLADSRDCELEGGPWRSAWSISSTWFSQGFHCEEKDGSVECKKGWGKVTKGPRSKSGHVLTLKSLSERLKGASSETCVVRAHPVGAEHAGTKSRKTSTRETTQEVRASLVSMKTLVGVVAAIAGEKIAALQYIQQETKTLSRQEYMKNRQLERWHHFGLGAGFGTRFCERCRKYHRRVPAREARKKQRW